MKKYQMYKCEVCNTMFNDRVKAVECEKSHITDFEIVEKVYKQGQAYPVKIIVSNGKNKRLYR